MKLGKNITFKQGRLNQVELDQIIIEEGKSSRTLSNWIFLFMQ